MLIMLRAMQDAGYLAMESVPKRSASAKQRGDACLAVCGVLDEEDLRDEDAECAVLHSTAGAVNLYDYHICHHASYSVPVLLFRGRSRAGETNRSRPLALCCLQGCMHLTETP